MGASQQHHEGARPSPPPPLQVVEWVRRNSTMKVHGPGEVMWEPGAEGEALPGMFVVISGVVRLDLEIEGRAVPMFLGAGRCEWVWTWRSRGPPCSCS